jgi:exopolysaccharide biosynthesis polyprenyl glycosylphosphotransferase
MIRRYIAAFRLALMAADAAAAVALFIGLSIIRFGPDQWRPVWAAAGLDAIMAAVVYGVTWTIVLWISGLYRLRARWSMRREVIDVLIAVLLLAVTVFIALFAFKLPNVSRLFLILLFPSQALMTIVSRAAIRWVFARLRERGFNTRYLLVVGANAAADRFVRRVLQHPELGVAVIGHLAGPSDTQVDLGDGDARPTLGAIEEIETVLHDRVVDEVAICLKPEDWDMVEPITRLCEDEGRVVRIPLEVPGFTLPGGRLEDLDGVQVLSLAYGPDRAIAVIVKRLFDVVVALVSLILLSPVLLGVALTVLLRDGRPILFRQVRLGLQGRPFRMVKFRTMVPDAEARLAEVAARNEIRGHAFKVTDDPRLTPTGQFLRRTSLDELPQLWNVLRGEMSIVGPRPPLPGEVAEYDIWHRRRLSMQPGMTGLWQVAGRRDEDFDRWVRLDLDYIDRWSLWLDLKIMLRTIPAVISQQGR